MKKGISLITLVITIIVIVILASTVIFTLNSTNIIENSNEAVFKSDISSYQDELTLYIASKMMEDSNFKKEELNAGTSEITNIITSMKDSHKEIFSIKNGDLVIDENANKKLKEWANEVGINSGVKAVTNEYEISTVEDLIAFRDKVNDGTIDTTRNVTLLKDIDLSLVENWTSIGDRKSVV